MVRSLKKLSAFLVCVCLCFALSPAALGSDATDAENFPDELQMANQLKSLGLFQGIGGNGEGTTDFNLGWELTREQAVVMLVRVLGKGAQAEAYPKTHPFTDVPAWADGYISYAYDNSLTNGISDTLFGGGDLASPAMYLTFMLRALGYSDEGGELFTWDAPWALAYRCGIMLPVRYHYLFLRADVVEVTCAALFAQMKGTETTLAEQLIEQGVFTAEEFAAAFPEQPFAMFRQVDAAVTEAIAARETLGLLGQNQYATECHIVTNMSLYSTEITVYALVCRMDAILQKGNNENIFTAFTDFWHITLDAETLAVKYIYPMSEMDVPGKSFSGGILNYIYSYMTGMDLVCQMEIEKDLEQGKIAYQQPTYAEALEEVTAGLTVVEKTLETAPCTILLGRISGMPHGSYSYLYLIYKPGSAVGEGAVVEMPMPCANAWFIREEPDDMWLSEDSLTLYYTYHFSEALSIEERLLHEAGTYQYTVDLNTGEVTLVIIPNTADAAA